MRIHVAIAFLATAVTLGGCHRSETGPRSEPVRPVKLAFVQAQAPELVFSASGRVKAAQRAELSFDRSDVLAELPVVQGQPIRKGDVLARLDTGNLQLQEKALQARFDELRAQVTRMRRLFERQAVAQVDLDRSVSACEAAESDLLQVRKDLQDSTLRAPFDGRVTATLAEQYQLVQPRQPVVVVHDISAFDIEIALPETFILRVGQTTNTHMAARFTHAPGRRFPVTLKSFATEATPDTLTYATTFRMPSPQDLVVLPGMSVTLDLAVQRDAAPGPDCWVPEAAVFSDDARRSFVWRISPEVRAVSRVEIVIGPARAGLVQVLSGGLAPGDAVAVSGLHALREGEIVSPYVTETHP